MSPEELQKNMAALAGIGLGHHFPGPFGKDAVAAGLCSCGCGGTPRIAPKTAAKDGWVKGRPVPTIYKHRRRVALPMSFRISDDGCWIWTRAKIQGYGTMKVDGRPVKPHRWIFEQVNGPLAPGLVPDHLCRQPACVNPSHIEAVTVAANTQRGDSARLSWGAVREIRAHAGRVTQEELGRRHGVTQTTIGRVIRGESWKELP